MPENRDIRVQLYAAVVGLCCFWIALPYGSVSLWAKSLAPALILLVACLGLVLDRSEKQRRSNTRSWMLLLPLGLLSVWSVCQLIPLPVSWLKMAQPNAASLYEQLFSVGDKTTISFQPVSTWNTSLLWLAMGWLTWTCSQNFCTRSTIRLACFWIAVLGTAQAIAGFVIPEMAEASSRPFASGRYTGTFSGANTFSGYLAITLPVTLGTLLTLMALILDEPEKTKFRYLRQRSNVRRHVFQASCLMLASLLQVVALILSSSRSALVTTTFTTLTLLGWFGWVNKKARSRNTLWAFVALVVLLVLLLGVGGTYSLTINRFHDIAGAGGGRLTIWKSAWELIMAHPLGVGFGAFPHAFPRFQPEGFGPTRFDHAHNDYLQLMGEWGWIGAIALLCILSWIAVKVLRTMQRQSNTPYVWIHRGIALAVTAGLLQAFVEFNLTSRPGVQVLFMFVMGLLCFDMRQVTAQAKATTRRPAWIPLLAVSSLVASLYFVWRVLPTATAAEDAWAALGEPGDLYYWKKHGEVGKKQALDQAQAAARRMPRLERVQYLHGQIHLLLHEQLVGQKIAALQAEDPYTPYEVHESSLLSSVRPKRSEAFHNARAAFDVGLKYNPWSIDLHSERARAMYETAFTEVDPAKIKSQLLRGEQEINLALELGPHDILVQTKVCQALAAAYEVVSEEEKKYHKITA